MIWLWMYRIVKILSKVALDKVSDKLLEMIHKEKVRTHKIDMSKSLTINLEQFLWNVILNHGEKLSSIPFPADTLLVSPHLGVIAIQFGFVCS